MLQFKIQLYYNFENSDWYAIETFIIFILQIKINYITNLILIIFVINFDCYEQNSMNLISAFYVKLIYSYNCCSLFFIFNIYICIQFYW